MARRGKRRGVAASVTVVLAVTLVAGGGIAGLLLAPSSAPESLSSAPRITQVPVEYSQFADTRQVPFKPQVAQEGELAAPRAGTLTSLTCQPGGVVNSGDVLGSIDATPVIALYTDYPLYRNLGAGDKGPDVAALQAELTRLGYAPSASGAMDWATRQAVKQWLSDRGFVKPDGTFSLASSVRLPAGQVQVAQCPLAPGSTVEEGDALVATGGGIVSLQLASAPENLTPGQRIVSYQDISAPVDDQGRVTDAQFLGALQGKDIWTGWKLSDGEIPLTLEYSLATALRTASVPAGALFGVAGGTGCIASADGTHRVTIVSSSLGSTYVTIDDGAEPASVSLATGNDRTAGGAQCS